jgi:hypothetical protein
MTLGTCGVIQCVFSQHLFSGGFPSGRLLEESVSYRTRDPLLLPSQMPDVETLS